MAFLLLNLRETSDLVANHGGYARRVEVYRSLKRRGEPLDEGGLIPGATAISSGLPLVTRNVRHYERLVEYGLRPVRSRHLPDARG